LISRNGAIRLLQAKLKEAAFASFPIILIVLLLSVSIAPVPSGTLLSFIFGALFLIIGMMLFTIGAEMAMSPIGEMAGSCITRSRKILLVLGISFLMGFIITIAEPDLQVLADQVPAIPSAMLILCVAAGVGLFLMLAHLRMLLSVPLTHILIPVYAVIFLLSALVPQRFLAISFDAGGVTTGPMTVPFIMALGVGVASIRNDRHAEDDSFGLVALSSAGPILAVMLLGIFHRAAEGSYTAPVIADVNDSVALRVFFLEKLPSCMEEMALSLLPIIVFYAILQFCFLRQGRRNILRILTGLICTYTGLVIFLTGVNAGFLPAGFFLGSILASLPQYYVIIPAAMLMGYFVVRAEPAVYVLMRQVEEITDGAVSEKLMGWSLSIGVAISLGLSMIRVISGLPLIVFLLPGYLLAIATSFFVPKIYTAIAFDSGGVASGPMTTAFLLPFAQGACRALGGDIESDAFGLVAMVAMTPLITIQLLGIYSSVKARLRHRRAMLSGDRLLEYDNSSIIEL